MDISAEIEWSIYRIEKKNKKDYYYQLSKSSLCVLHFIWISFSVFNSSGSHFKIFSESVESSVVLLLATRAGETKLQFDRESSPILQQIAFNNYFTGVRGR